MVVRSRRLVEERVRSGEDGETKRLRGDGGFSDGW